jgi:hypothetical protein
MTTSSTIPSETLHELVAQINVQMSRDPRAAEMERVRRNANRLGSVLGLVGSVVAIYDLSLLAGLAR